MTETSAPARRTPYLNPDPVGFQRHYRAADLRTGRYKSFVDFWDQARALFPAAMAGVSGASFFNSYYSFHVLPGTSDSGHGQRYVQAFYGKRPYDSVEASSRAPGMAPQRSIRLRVEEGATLFYHIGPTGHVVCQLYHASILDGAVGDRYLRLDRIEPKTLHQPHVLRRHLRNLIACMACTSLDGAPTVRQRMRWHWLTWTNPSYVEDVYHEPPARTALRKFGWWVATVGCSGAVLFGIQQIFPAPDTTKPAVERSTAQITAAIREQTNTFAPPPAKAPASTAQPSVAPVGKGHAQ
ncbi:hypothetical protein H8Z72_22900 (plasmid) [Xanthomonas citri pv. citri]|uniref:hypothetical protein n=1 Tax=Xanthomonas citri TaxID=346 RepID=UPI0019346B15|nr:hypothetical protein [Xanthomonas citri]QRD62620.1 hypothetical protein H8Z74_23285 [Xanthomonas citri pv. citri]QRD67154.1 hypothetical protein H8Z73_22260 [Xanthomonas citri pv. citri]QRD71800.1 hypothetical protein H8Z72_22900 [Xanthomonas citri pv. citri]